MSSNGKKKFEHEVKKAKTTISTMINLQHKLMLSRKIIIKNHTIIYFLLLLIIKIA